MDYKRIEKALKKNRYIVDYVGESLINDRVIVLILGNNDQESKIITEIKDLLDLNVLSFETIEVFGNNELIKKLTIYY